MEESTFSKWNYLKRMKKFVFSNCDVREKIAFTAIIIFLFFEFSAITGIALNQCVQHANGGFMPVFMEHEPILLAGKHIPMTEETRLNFLGDCIVVEYRLAKAVVPQKILESVGASHEYSVSIGDIFIEVGVIGMFLTFCSGCLVCMCFLIKRIPILP